MHLRNAILEDCVAINDIHNFYILNSTCTYLLETQSIVERQKWLTEHGERHPAIVAVDNDQVIGWGCLSPFHPRPAYGNSVETTVYVHPEHFRRGVGRAIVEELIDRARLIGHHTVIALISAEQVASVALHEKAGFKHAGLLKEAGYKHKLWLDVVYMQLML